MSYVQPDFTPITILGPGALSAGPNATAGFLSWGFTAADLSVHFTNVGVGPITAVDVVFQWANISPLLSPASTDWADVLTETIALGVATEFTYTPTAIPVVAAPSTLGLRCRTMGTWMRMVITPTGDPAGSGVLITVVRR